MVFLIFSIGMTAGGSRFFREPMPPEIKKQAGKEVQITGQVYQIEVRESYQILYLILSKKTDRILVSVSYTPLARRRKRNQQMGE